MDIERQAELLSDMWREALGPDEPAVPVEELDARRTHLPSSRRIHVVTHEDGFAEVVFEHDDLWVAWLIVDPSHRRRGLGRALLRDVLDVTGGRARHTVAVGTPGEAFARSSGATAGIESQQLRLPTAALDRPTMTAWAAPVPGYHLHRVDGVCPDELLAGFAEVIDVMNTAPRSEGVPERHVTPDEVRDGMTAHVAQGHRPWTLLLEHVESGRLAGYTELSRSPFRPWLATQGDTAVDPAHRGHGLGRLLKGTNALRLLDEAPEVTHVETYNASENGPMLAINHAMGFRTAARWRDWSLSA